MGNYDPNDPVAVYIDEACTVEPLTKTEESNLFRELAGPGDWNEAQENVARRLIEGHLSQVVSTAQKHAASGFPLLELIQAGNRGLMNAVKSFAVKPVGDFTDYAALYIDEAIKKALA